MTDALRHLAHDHGDLNRRVRSFGASLRANATRTDLSAALTELRELLFLHFAREEEGLFPFVAEVAPDLHASVTAMEIAHDTICGALARMVHLASSTEPLDALGALFERFETSYAKHAETESKLLASLEQRIDAVQRDRLSELVDGL